MKAIITQKSELTLNLKQYFTFDIVDADGSEILTSQSIECSPSTAVAEIQAKLQAYQQEYETSQELEIGQEIS
jgi:hypothetical protein